MKFLVNLTNGIFNSIFSFILFILKLIFFAIISVFIYALGLEFFEKNLIVFLIVLFFTFIFIFQKELLSISEDWNKTFKNK